MLKTSDIKSMAQILRNMKHPPVEEDTDKDEPGTQGDKEEYQRKRKEIAKKFGVESCSALKDEEKRKACYAALDAAHVSDDEEEDEDDDPVGKNEEIEIDESLALQLKMAFDDAKIKMKSKNMIQSYAGLCLKSWASLDCLVSIFQKSLVELIWIKSPRQLQQKR